MQDRQTEIFAYLAGQMEEADRTAFEGALQADTALAEAVEKLRPVFTATRLQGQLHLKNQMQQWEQELGPEQSGRLRAFPRWMWGVAAAAVIGFFFLAYWINRPVPQGPDALYATYFEAFPPPINVRSEKADELTPWQIGAQAYMQGAYAQAAEAFAQSHDSLPDYLRNFYLAQALMARENPDFTQAVSLLQTVQSSDNDYQEAASWYMALIYIRREEYSRAKEILNGLKTYRQEEVEALLAQLP
ncbi:MAG: tetratricopeptide repeat protein [Bacteroidota bacterium]